MSLVIIRGAVAARAVGWVALVCCALVCCGLWGCDDGDAAQTRDAGAVTACQVTGCPGEQVCLESGRCATPQAVAEAATRCVELDACLVQCVDDACVNACAEGAGDAAIDRYNALFQCISFNDCISPTGGVDVECMQADCAMEYEGCPLPLPAQPEGATRCGGFVRCLNGCPFDPPDAEAMCLDDCVRDASPMAFDLYLAAIDCVSTNCPGGDPMCQASMCGEALDACFEDGLGTGELPCDDVMDCVFSCPDQACYERCEVDASPEAFALWRTFVDCAAPAGCNGYQECLATCPDETRACESDR